MNDKIIYGNAILLAMSIPRMEEGKYKVEKLEFVWSGETGKEKEIKIGDCRGQLEPVVKLMIDDIETSKENKNLRIIILSTDKTLNSNEAKPVKCGDEETEPLTAVEYFKNRINEYSVDKKVNIDYLEIPIHEENLVEGIEITTEKVRELYNQCENLNFWIDTHGGFRDVTFVCSAIISLLRLENPKHIPDMILGVRHDSEKTTKKIVNQKDMFEIFKFVCGMQDFAKNGNADILEEFSSNESDKAIVAMQTIADGLKECDPNKYVSGIEKFVKLNENDKIDKRDDMLKIFAPYIEGQYEGLIDENGEIRVERVIKRCVDKGLYQQALTLIESKMPEYVMDRKLIYYDISEEEIIVEMKNEVANYKDNKNFVFDSYLNSLYYYKLKLKKSSHKELVSYMKGDFGDKLDKSFGTKYIKLNKKKPEIKIHAYTYLSKREDMDKAGEFMRMHKALKKCRNTFNHSLEDRVEMKLIVDMMYRYITTIEELLKILPPPQKNN